MDAKPQVLVGHGGYISAKPNSPHNRHLDSTYTIPLLSTPNLLARISPASHCTSVMLPARLTRAAQRAASSAPSISCSACYASRSSRSSHQRRHSSSKASWPPDSSSKPAPAAKAASAAKESVSDGPVSAARPPSRGGKSKTKSAGHSRRDQQLQEGEKKAKDEIPDQYAALPSVPMTQDLDVKSMSGPIYCYTNLQAQYDCLPIQDLNLASFFSLHRPISITSSIPPPSSQATFNNIFESRPNQDNWANGNSAERRPEDVIYTLQTTIETLESQEDEGVRWQIVHESPSNNPETKHLDGPPRLKSLEDLVAQFKPFKAPPPPQAFSELEQVPQRGRKSQKDKRASAAQQGRGRPPKQKLFTTTITITESTDANGQREYVATSTPIVPLQAPNKTGEEVLEAPAYRTRRQRKRDIRMNTSESPASSEIERAIHIPLGLRRQRVKMMLISVKRQRKLKMKKHKYKKLMKRTRNLRRRLERN